MIKKTLQGKRRQLLFLLMLISVGLMLICDSNLTVIPAAVFTFLYFGRWLKDSAGATIQWVHHIKNYFAIFREYADKFVEIFTKEEGGEGKKL